METAITYARKSVKVKGNSPQKSVSYQQVTMDEYAKKQGLKILKKYSDIGYSGKNLERPELKEMYRDLQSNKVNYLLVYSVDRFGRDLVNNIDTMLEVLELVEHVVFITENFSSSSEYFKMFFLILTAMSQEERERLLSRVAKGRQVKVLHRNEYDGKYPFGYIKHPNNDVILPATGEYTEDSSKIHELYILKFIFYSYLSGLSLRKTASILNEKFGPTKNGKRWSYKSVQYMLNNRHYSGYLTGVLEKNNHYLIKSENVIPVIDPLLHEKVIRMLKNESRGRKKTNTFNLPIFCLCKKCGNILKEDNWLLRCEKCVSFTESNVLIEKMKKETELIIKRKLDYLPNANLGVLIDQYKKKKKKLLQKEIRLLKNKEFIETSAHFDELTKLELLEINSKEYCKVKQEVIIATELEKCLSNTKETTDDFIDNSFLIKLPFLVVIDFGKEIVEIVFHPKFFLGDAI